jgi:hypothetical protein
MKGDNNGCPLSFFISLQIFFLQNANIHDPSVLLFLNIDNQHKLPVIGLGKQKQ